jgi:hypothetical protein
MITVAHAATTQPIDGIDALVMCGLALFALICGALLGAYLHGRWPFKR